MRHEGRSSRDRQDLAIIDAAREILTTFDQIAVRGCAKDGDHIEVQSAKIGAAKGKHRACVNSRPSASMSRQTVTPLASQTPPPTQQSTQHRRKAKLVNPSSTKGRGGREGECNMTDIITRLLIVISVFGAIACAPMLSPASAHVLVQTK